MPRDLLTASARELTKALAGEKHRDTFANGCAYCGRPCFGYACRDHRDLPQLEQQLLNPPQEG